MTNEEKAILSNLCLRYQHSYPTSKFYNEAYRPAPLIEKIEEQLKNSYRKSGDLELLVMLAAAELLTPMEDFDGSAAFCKQLLEIQPDDLRARLMLAYIEDYRFDAINDQTLSELLTIESSDQKIMSARSYFVAKYYTESDMQKHEDYLQKAIKLFPGNLLATSYLLSFSHQTDRSERIAKRALEYAAEYQSNEKREPLDLLSFETFLHERIFGVLEDYFPIKKHAKGKS